MQEAKNSPKAMKYTSRERAYVSTGMQLPVHTKNNFCYGSNASLSVLKREA